MPGAPDSLKTCLAQFWTFYEAARELPIKDSFGKIAILCALFEATETTGASKGVPISAIQDRVGLTANIVRYHLRALEGKAVYVSGQKGKAELFAITESARIQLIRCLAPTQESGSQIDGAAYLTRVSGRT